MQNLKSFYDAALAADADVKRILAEMDSLFSSGTDEGKQNALALRPALEEAKAKAESANQLYVSVRDASLTSDNAAALFSAPPDPGEASDRAAGKNVKTLAEFNAMSPSDRLAFSKSGGRLID
jgi:ElaB/YqjD/DUF883 family membrane-anchored ribosome-binding protein